MNKETYKKVIDELTKERKGVSETKRKDYTVENEDQFYNFKFIADLVGIEPLEVWAVYKLKHTLAIMNYVQNKHESEPIRERFIDELNYGELGFGLVLEQEEPEHFENLDEETKEAYEATKDKIPSFCDTPNACHHDGCMCERTNKGVEGEQRDITKRFVKSIYFHRKTDVFDVLYNNGYGKIIPEKEVIDIQQSYDSPNYLDWLETENEIYVVEDGKGTQDA